MLRGVWLSDPLPRRNRYQPKKGANMPHAIVIGANGRRHEVDFEDAEGRAREPDRGGPPTTIGSKRDRMS